MKRFPDDLVLSIDDDIEYPDNYIEGASALPAVNVTIAVSNNFADKGNEEFIAFLSKYKTSSALTSEGLAYMQETGSNYADTAKWFLSEHSELLDEWLKAEDAQTMKDFLSK